jgi:hypothetical protein
MMKLFTIGDSISQGFMSGAAARTDLCYSTLLARSMGLAPGSADNAGIDYFYPEWKEGGLPANLESILRRLNQRYGSHIRGMEWMTILHHINRVLDASEDYYKRKGGKARKKYHGGVPYFHNVSSWTYDVADSWLVTPELCMEEIAKRRPIDGVDGWLSVANAAFYRTALKVLSPNLDYNYSQLDWLKHHARTRGVENFVLWLGSNNVLKTLLTFEIVQTTNDPGKRPHHFTHRQRRKRGWNLWHPGDFAAEYTELIERVHHIMTRHNICKNWKVFVGTIPYTSMLPLLKGIGPKSPVGPGAYYHKYYTYVMFKDKFAMRKNIYLPFHSIRFIEDRISQYNTIIQDTLDNKNEELQLPGDSGSNGNRYHVVDICDVFARMDWRRTNGRPSYQFPDYFDAVEPPLDTNYYHVTPEGKRVQGGIFSLDGIHPSAIGQGLIAREFMKVMKNAGVQFKHSLDWPGIFASDSLYQEPITMMHEIYRHKRLAQHLIKLIKNYVHTPLSEKITRRLFVLPFVY